MSSIINLLRRELPEIKISADVSYKELTSLGCGSAPLPVLAEPDNEAQLVKLLKLLAKKGHPLFLFGAGTNLVGSDRKCKAVGIRLAGKAFSRVAINGNCVECGAYAKLPLLASLCGKAGLGGLAPLSGIPGSIGGALRMNAGANGVEISSLVKEVRGFFYDGKPYCAGKDDIQWFYRGNSIPEDVIITEAVFELRESNAALEEEEICLENEHRRKREPAGRTAGCAFRNISPQDSAGKLIDECGLRGLRVGDLLVSEKHANYLMNTGDATEADYLEMIRILRRAVSDKHGFYLRTEIIPVNPELSGLIESDTPAPRVNVLCGGVSSEREVSLKSGETVSRALRNAGFKVDHTDIRKCEITGTMLEADVVYPVLHGGFGEDGTLQRMLEEAAIRFVGSGSASSWLVMDKIATKRLLDKIALPTARWAVVTRSARQIPEDLHFPLVVKAPCEGSTVGIEIVQDARGWDDALDKVFKYADELLVEEFIEGTEITVPVLTAVAMEVIEIVPPSGGVYDWDAKYVYRNGTTEYFCPPRSLPPAVTELAREYALKFYHAAGCRDILRVDFIVDADGVPRVLEGNSLPGNTDHSLVPKAAQHAGMSMEKMTALMVYCAMKRSGEAPSTLAPEKRGGRMSKFFGRLFDTVCNLAGLFAAGILLYAGYTRQETSGEVPSLVLISGGILVAIFALCRQFDRR